MYILNSTRYEKKTRALMPDGKGNCKVWIYPASLFNKMGNAQEAMTEAVNNAIDRGKKAGTFVRLHESGMETLKVVECSDCTTVFRITQDTPLD